MSDSVASENLKQQLKNIFDRLTSASRDYYNDDMNIEDFLDLEFLLIAEVLELIQRSDE